MVHALVGIQDNSDLSGYSVYGQSWEGFILEQILGRMPHRTEATFYRSSAGAEVDLVLETPRDGVYAIEIKRSLSPKISKGFHLACQEIQPQKRFYVIPTQEAYPLDAETTAIGIEELLSHF